MIHPDCIQKVLNLGGNESVKQGLVDLFRAAANDAESQDLPSGTIVIPFYDESSKLQPGDWAAELHCVVRKVESVDETDQTGP